MTWKRVATAVVLIPLVVGIVLFTSTAVVAIATAVITVLALWEYFALGEAIGHRAYRLWTIFCSLVLICAQWTALNAPKVLISGEPKNVLIVGVKGEFWFLLVTGFLFAYVLGLAAL